MWCSYVARGLTQDEVESEVAEAREYFKSHLKRSEKSMADSQALTIAGSNSFISERVLDTMLSMADQTRFAHDALALSADIIHKQGKVLPKKLLDFVIGVATRQRTRPGIKKPEDKHNYCMNLVIFLYMSTLRINGIKLTGENSIVAIMAEAVPWLSESNAIKIYYSERKNCYTPGTKGKEIEVYSKGKLRYRARNYYFMTTIFDDWTK